ncbi:hypothetical protein [Undibacterium sp. Tian12W]|uniref:hypothetical protein n=1 Tax=Undibacterium sp. Tian12W TaxID=3413054 RepID=UPI003BF119C3
MVSLLTAQLFLQSVAFAAPAVSAQTLNQIAPVLQPAEVVESARDFLVKAQRRDMKKYVLAHVSFTYFSEWNNSKEKFKGEWYVRFEQAGLRAVDSHIVVYVTNEKKPSHKLGMAP